MSLHHFWVTEDAENAAPCLCWGTPAPMEERPAALRRDNLSPSAAIGLACPERWVSAANAAVNRLSSPLACLLSERPADNPITIYILSRRYHTRIAPFRAKPHTEGPLLSRAGRGTHSACAVRATTGAGAARPQRRPGEVRPPAVARQRAASRAGPWRRRRRGAAASSSTTSTPTAAGASAR